MVDFNANNERVKRQYFAYLKEAKRQNEASVDAAAKALARFESYTGFRDFKSFHRQQAVGFKRRLADQNSQVTGEKLSKATLHSTLSHLTRFFAWLAGQPGYKSKMTYADSEYFNASEKDARIAGARRARPVPSIDQIRRVIACMPAQTDVELRNRALIAFALVTGARDAAIASLKLKHIDLLRRCVHQDAREVKTKFSKTFTTFFFPVGDDLQQIVIDWIGHLKAAMLWGDEDPLFPATHISNAENHLFRAGGLKRVHWNTATPIRQIFRQSFTVAGLPYFNPHSFRSTLARLGESMCRTPEDFKAWSQNLGHEAVLTTFLSYGTVDPRRQAQIMGALSSPAPGIDASTAELARVIAEHFAQRPVRSMPEPS